MVVNSTTNTTCDTVDVRLPLGGVAVGLVSAGFLRKGVAALNQGLYFSRITIFTKGDLLTIIIV